MREDAGHLLEHLIPHVVAVGVVDVLEKVDVAHDADEVALMDIFNEAYGFKDMDNMLYELENNGVSEISTEYIFRDLEKAEEFKKAGIRDACLIYGVK